MTRVFSDAKVFNGDLSKWDVSSVTKMPNMFRWATSFNADLSKWDVSNVGDMNGMFNRANSFNSDLSEWDVSSVPSMLGMFRDATSFNTDISKWDVSRVDNMDYMFRGAILFKQKLFGPAWVHSKASKKRMFSGSSGSISRTVCTSALAFSPQSGVELKEAVDVYLRQSCRRPIPIIYRDEDLLIVSKPSGILVTRGWDNPKYTLIDLLREQLDIERLYVLHRLDRGTSGVMAFALNRKAAQHISSAFRSRRIGKHYLALVRGSFEFSGILDHAVPKAPGETDRVEAQTAFRGLAQAETSPRETSVVLACPKTGRTHQIRRHLNHLNHPIIGDSTYGKGVLNRAARARYDLDRLGLHAWRLELPHPTLGRVQQWTSDIPVSLSDPLTKMGYNVSNLYEQASHFADLMHD